MTDQNSDAAQLIDQQRNEFGKAISDMAQKHAMELAQRAAAVAVAKAAEATAIARAQHAESVAKEREDKLRLAKESIDKLQADIAELTAQIEVLRAVKGK